MAKIKKIENIEKDVAYHVVSYMAQDVRYVDWIRKSDKDIPHAGFSVLIKGGAGVVDKVTLKAPKGVITPISPEEYEFLVKDSAFKRHRDAGFVKICVTEKAAKKALEPDDAPRDNGSQLTEEDFLERGLTPPTIAK